MIYDDLKIALLFEGNYMVLGGEGKTLSIVLCIQNCSKLCDLLGSD